MHGDDDGRHNAKCLHGLFLLASGARKRGHSHVDLFVCHDGIQSQTHAPANGTAARAIFRQLRAYSVNWRPPDEAI